MIAATLRALLAELVDYAGLYPPAALPMAVVVANYDTYHRSADRWALGRLIIPLARLGEFSSALDSVEISSDDPWRVSAIATNGFATSASSIASFNSANTHRSPIDCVEFRVSSVGDIESAAHAFGPDLQRFAEFPSHEMETYAAVLRDTGTRAKIRTGGVTPAAFPETSTIASFIGALRGVSSFKATAGLHHPLRSTHPLTYETGAVCGTMHGFLNVFLAAVFAHGRHEPATVQGILDETDIGSIAFSNDAIVWHGHTVTLADVIATRTHFALSFGSCSFREPVNDLTAIGLL